MNATQSLAERGHGAARTLRSDVLVRHEDRWCPGKLRAWDETRTGERRGLVTWHPVPGEIRIDRLPEDRIRQP